MDLTCLVGSTLLSTTCPPCGRREPPFREQPSRDSYAADRRPCVAEAFVRHRPAWMGWILKRWLEYAALLIAESTLIAVRLSLGSASASMLALRAVSGGRQCVASACCHGEKSCKSSTTDATTFLTRFANPARRGLFPGHDPRGSR